MATLDLASYAAVLVTFLLGVCIAILFFFMRDREHAPLHAVRRLVWCPRHERTAMVEFNERIQTGLALRTVRHCPLRRPGELCGEGCAWESACVPEP